MWSDIESEKDYLNFGEISQIAADIISSPSMLPVSIGVFGNWGAGKSSILRLIEGKLRQDGDRFIVIRFDAWLYQGFDDARAALIEVIATELSESVKNNEPLVSKINGFLKRIDGFRALGLVAEGAALAFGVPTGGLIYRGMGAVSGLANGINNTEEYKDLAGVAKEAGDTARGLLKPAEKKSPPQQITEFRKEYGEILSEIGKPLVVIIDNLDRCIPIYAIHALEAIRLFLFMHNTAFVIAADEDMIRLSVADYFKGSSERHQIDYIDKLIQIPIRVPKAGIREIRAYLFMLYAIDSGLDAIGLEKLHQKLEDSLQQAWKSAPIPVSEIVAFLGIQPTTELAIALDRADRIAPILATSPVIQGNPRIVKRLLNVVKMRMAIAKRRSIPLNEEVITKLVIFERCMSGAATALLYRLIDVEDGKPQLIDKLESSKEGDESIKLPEEWGSNQYHIAFVREWARLDPPFTNLDLRPGLYLARETVQLAVHGTGLSEKGREAIKVLLSSSNRSSPTVAKTLDELAPAEYVPLMEELIKALRRVQDWSTRPKGFSASCELAERNLISGEILSRFLSSLFNPSTSQPAWLKAMLKDQQWYKA